jgi:excisionase family DNA binding protein
MQTEKLPLPNPGDWITINGAAELLDCSRRTVERMVDAGTLQLHVPRHGEGERVQGWLWYAQVDEVKRARQVLRRAERDTEAR